MPEYENFEEEEREEAEEEEPHHFCKLTFGQFFTLMVLEVITLCFVFYLGARYGNEYLKLGVIKEAKKNPISIVTERTVRVADSEEAELQEMARSALEGEKVDLKQKVQEILDRQRGPSAPPMGEPTFENNPSNAELLQRLQEMRPDLAQPAYNSGVAMQRPAQAISGEFGPRPGSQTFVPSPRPKIPETEQIVKVKSTGNAKFSVQVGSYPDVKEASYRVEEWKVKGYPAYMMIANLGDKGRWYRVRIGAFADKNKAGNYLEGMKGKEGIEDAFVVQNEQ